MTVKLALVVDRPAERLDRFVAERRSELSRSQVQRLIRSGHVTVNGSRARPSLVLRAGDRVQVAIPPPEPVALSPEPLPLAVVYEDADLLVVDKPPGMTVHPAPGHPHGTLANAVLAHCPGLEGVGGALRPGIVHRLDKDTSGLLVVAKNDLAHRSLSLQMKERHVKKAYLALVWGHPKPAEGVIEAPIGRDPKNRKRMAVAAGGREAVTRYRTLKRLRDFSLLEALPETGRTHQIRVHLAHIGHPIAGDPLYSKRKLTGLERQFLHAHRLGFRHPRTGEWLELTSPLPEDLAQALRMVE